MKSHDFASSEHLSHPSTAGAVCAGPAGRADCSGSPFPGTGRAVSRLSPGDWTPVPLACTGVGVRDLGPVGAGHWGTERSLFSLWLTPAGTEALQKAEGFVGAGINAGEQKRMNENKEPKSSCFVIQSFQCCFAYAYSQLMEGGSS